MESESTPCDDNTVTIMLMPDGASNGEPSQFVVNGKGDLGSQIEVASRESPASGHGSTTPGVRHIRFSTELDIALLREVVRYTSPFRRGSLAWEKIAALLAKNEKLSGISARTVRERAERLVRKHKGDISSVQKQAGTSEQYAEKAQLLDRVVVMFDARENDKLKASSGSFSRQDDEDSLLNEEQAGGETPVLKRLRSIAGGEDAGCPSAKRRATASIVSIEDEPSTSPSSGNIVLTPRQFMEELEVRRREVQLERERLEFERERWHREINLRQQREQEEREERNRMLCLLMLMAIWTSFRNASPVSR